ncbi:biotin/lipoyl-binding protein [Cyanobium sp. HWJ4-Hawea]|nr:biotin/lipoyl-binding protein [Cyanobium sp. HWJ4-Hawea]
MSERIPQLLPIAAVTGLGLVWALAPSVPMKVEGSALLLPPESRVGVYARSPGQVQELHRRVGDQVKQGDLLLSINRVDQQAAGGGSVGPATNALLDQIQAVDRQKQTIESRIGTLRTANQPVGLQLKALENLRRDEVIPRYSPLWVGAQDLYLRNLGSIQELQAQLAQMDATRAELLAQRNSQSVFAPLAGMLLSLGVNPGQAVTPGQRLATVGLGPKANGIGGISGQRTAIALFSDADVARLRPGMPIQLDLQLQTRDRYGGSSQRYGLVEGLIASISPANADLAEVARAAGDLDLASSLIARSRQAAFGEGGDPMATLPDKITAPVRVVTVNLERADTPSGLRWSGSRGPDLSLENGTPAKSEVVVERRRPLSFVLPFLRWLGGMDR